MTLSTGGVTFRFQDFDSNPGEAYVSLASPACQPRFKQLGWTEALVAAGASVDGRPAGVALAEYFASDRAAEVLDLQVAPEARNLGLGAGLLERMEQALAARGCERARLFYRTNEGTPRALERVLQKRGWSAPAVSRHLYTVGQQVLEAPWMASRPPAGIEFFPWSELQEVERIQIDDGAGEWFPFNVYPFIIEAFDPQTSLGVRRRGELAGWLITQRLSEAKVFYEQIFVAPELQGMEVATALLAEGIRRQCQGPGPHFGLFGVRVNNAPMQQLVDKLFSPYYTATAEEMKSSWAASR